MYPVKTILFYCGLFSGVVTHGMATPALDLLLGHFEVQVDYTDAPGNPDAGWRFSISYDTTNNFNTPEGIVRLDPADTRIVATPDTEVVLSGPLGGLGDAGDTLWLLPQANLPGQIFFGWRSLIQPGIFQLSNNGRFFPHPLGSIKIALVDISGPAVDAGGHFAMWESGSVGGVEMHFNTADGINGNDEIDNIPSGIHTHYNYGLTRPGNYAVTFRASGRLNAGGQPTSGTGTFHFAVPFSSTVSGQAELRLSIAGVAGPAAVHPVGGQVEYSPGQVALLTEAMEVNNIARNYAFCIVPVTDHSGPEPHRVGISGVEAVRFQAGIQAAANPLEVTGFAGPGNLEVVQDGSGRQYFLFSESGIYRVRLRAAGIEAGSPVYSSTFELVFLAGLGSDYNFAAWADSFERIHGLAPGSLQDDGSDWDGDGVPDVIEYQLFWEGFDPAVPDADQLPHPDPNHPEGLIVFHRDTYKDRLNRNTQNIVLEYSANFSNWLGWSERVPGWPLEQFESGAERGNAFGRIQRRALRLPANGTPAQGFFRWRIDPAL